METEVHHRILKRKPLLPVLNQINPILTLPSYVFMIYFRNILPSTPRSFCWCLLMNNIWLILLLQIME
jgi:hypothetical protein